MATGCPLLLQNLEAAPVITLVLKGQIHRASVALSTMHYNFGRIPKTLRVTPAVEAGIRDHGWSAEEIARLAE